jgi:hypothetical protein
MAKGTAFSNSLLEFIFTATTLTIPADLYIGLYTGDPSTGSQTTNEISYPGYARVALVRGAAFTVTGNSVSPTANVTFPTSTGGTAVATFVGIGSLTTGAGVVYYSGACSPTIVCSTGIAPVWENTSTITES